MQTMALAMDKGGEELGSNLLSGVSLPAAVVHEGPLAHNVEWMQRFAEAHGARLAPHGKTTMTPALFHRQLQAGAWGITLATAPQCRAAFANGVTRILMANQLVGQANMAIIACLIEQGAAFYCVVDSHENARQLGCFFAERGLTLSVLIEIGVEGGRCGCRNQQQILSLAEAIANEPALSLVGLEGYEGVVHGDNPESGIRNYAKYLVDAAVELEAAGRFAEENPIVTASGSAWYDVIAEAFQGAPLQGRFTPVLRPGCYIVHDHGLYREAQSAVLGRRPDLQQGLEPALEVFAQVQSLPEPGLAIVALGKRDIGHDQLPIALRRFREAGEPSQSMSVAGWEVTKIMDQHTFVRLPEGAQDVEVGDIVAFGASHPCLTFDKWRQILLVDDQLNVKERMATYF
ncbi:amino acid deaminase [Halomonas sp. QX-2]|jgi:D-serine deaminase-like pyridoxal phosphate-dependent protein|uniref:Amino acid deaminase n=1 Tax=Vreelandella sedimenti TaxID=2729618 RepID=A0A7Z0N547_9GAMM|nr:MULTISPECIES: amino acid deaminase [Halomonas]NYT71583.1 amino acid deaminase [Halomonas sedimenti]|tara:strand:+ start:23291 stop:24499 length:1209 start_codon:yes stop_codon:yes gene_type:complete